MKLSELIASTPVGGAVYIVSDIGNVTVVGDILTANVHQIDHDDMVWVARNMGRQILGSRSVRISKPDSGDYRLEVAFQRPGPAFDRIDPSEAKAIAVGYGDGSDSDAVFQGVVGLITPHISRELNHAERFAIAQALAWDNSNNEPELSTADFIKRLSKFNKNLADELRPLFDNL